MLALCKSYWAATNKIFIYARPCVIKLTWAFFVHCRSVIKEFAHAFSCAYIELWMHLGSLESTQKARVALGCASSSATLTYFSCSPNFPRTSITRYKHAKHEQNFNLGMRTSVRNFATCRSRQSGKKVKKQKKKKKKGIYWSSSVC